MRIVLLLLHPQLEVGIKTSEDELKMEINACMAAGDELYLSS